MSLSPGEGPLTPAQAPRGRPRRAAPWIAGALVVALVILGTALATAPPGAVLPRDPAGGVDLPLVADESEALTPRQVAAFDPFRFDPEREEELVERGRDGYEHPLYVKSPGGVEAAAARTGGYRGRIQSAAAGNGVNANTLEAILFLESGGRPEVIAGDDPENAVGLAQILPSTATDLLGMSVDLPRSQRLTRRIDRDRRRVVTARTARARREAAIRVRELSRERRRIDDRFNPTRSIGAAARYLAIAGERFGREDLAAVSYHMGMGNLEDVVEDYVAPRRPRRRPSRTVSAYDLSYARLFYDSGPRRNRAAFERLASFGDDSRTYLFRVEAAKEIMRLQRGDPRELRAVTELHLAKASAEEVLRPASDTEVFDDSVALREAYEDAELVPLPSDPGRLGFRIDRRLGELARSIDTPRELYSGLRPEALATLLFVAKETRLQTGEDTALLLTSGVRDRPYQRLLVATNPEATENYSLHTTGYAFDIALPRSERRRDAVVGVLERLRSLRVVDFVFEPAAIHVTVGPDAEELLPLYEGLIPPEPR